MLRIVLLVSALMTVLVAGVSADVRGPGVVLDDHGFEQSYGGVPGRSLTHVQVPVVIDPDHPTALPPRFVSPTGGDAPDRASCEQRPNCALVPLEVRASRVAGYEIRVDLEWDGGTADGDLDLFLYVFDRVSQSWQTYAASAGSTTREAIREPDVPSGQYFLGVSNQSRTPNDGFRLTGSITYV